MSANPILTDAELAECERVSGLHNGASPVIVKALHHAALLGARKGFVEGAVWHSAWGQMSTNAHQRIVRYQAEQALERECRYPLPVREVPRVVTDSEGWQFLIRDGALWYAMSSTKREREAFVAGATMVAEVSGCFVCRDQFTRPTTGEDAKTEYRLAGMTFAEHADRRYPLPVREVPKCEDCGYAKGFHASWCEEHPANRAVCIVPDAGGAVRITPALAAQIVAMARPTEEAK